MNLFNLTPAGIKLAAAEKLINERYPNLLNKISYEVKNFLPLAAYEKGGETIDGGYNNGIIYINDNSQLETFIHEIGHAVHYQLFNAKKIDLPILDQEREYNHKEVFAEAFKDSVLNEIPNERDKKIIAIIKEA